MKSGTCTTSPVLIVAGFFHPVAVSHLSPGGVSITSKTTLGSKLIFTGIPLNSCKVTLSQSFKKYSDQSKDFLFKLTCSKVV
jgi:hypothetical protein